VGLRLCRWWNVELFVYDSEEVLEMKFGDTVKITKREATVGILVCLAYSVILLAGLWILGVVW